MAVALKDVPCWGTLGTFKTAHALVWAEGGGMWCQTLCGTMTSSHKRHTDAEPPKLICRECRKLLKEDSIRLEK